MGDSEEHMIMKKLAIDLLKLRGFTDNQIEVEYEIKDPSMTKTLRIDVVAIDEKQNKKIAIECGVTPAHKIAQLDLFFDEVIFLPFVSTIESLSKTEHYEKEIREKNIKIEQLEKQIKFYMEKEQNFRDALYQYRERYREDF